MGDALGAYRQALKWGSTPAIVSAAALMAEAIEDHIVSEANRRCGCGGYGDHDESHEQ